MSGSMFDDPLFTDGSEKGVHDRGQPVVNGVDPYAPHPDDPGPDPPDESTGAEPTTWEPVDLGPYLRGEIERPEPSIGVYRSDGLRLIYPGREHAIVGATESGKTWLSTSCAAAEIAAGNRVLYIHFEEPDPASTIERLMLLGATGDELDERLRFVAPVKPVREGWMAKLLAPAPTLVVLDGINEGMALHQSTMDTDGWSSFRRWIVTPCMKKSAAVVSCDHIPMGADGTRVNAYGTVHKGNTLDGARIQLENVEPFGRGLRGVTHVFVTKDRPGFLRAHGKPTKVPGKTYMGTLIADDSNPFEPLTLKLFAPRDDEKAPEADPGAALADAVHDVIVALPDGAVESVKKLKAHLRAAEVKYRNEALLEALEDLVVAGRLVEVSGMRGAKGYKAAATCPQPSSTDDPDGADVDLSPRPVPFKDRDAGDRSNTHVSQSSGIGGDTSGQVGSETAETAAVLSPEPDEGNEPK